MFLTPLLSQETVNAHTTDVVFFNRTSSRWPIEKQAPTVCLLLPTALPPIFFYSLLVVRRNKPILLQGRLPSLNRSAQQNNFCQTLAEMFSLEMLAYICLTLT